jgi:transposase InsO family protein
VLDEVMATGTSPSQTEWVAMDVNKTLSRLFYDMTFPTAYSGSPALLTRALLAEYPRLHGARSLVNRWLATRDEYTQFKRAPIRNYKTPQVRVPPVANRQIQIDLMDMFKNSDVGGHRYILVVIDCLSRYAWLRAVHGKTSKEVASAFVSVLEDGEEEDELPCRARLVQSDAGKEFLGAPFQQMLRERGIKFFTTPSNTKASMAERLIRTLRERMMRFFRATRSSNHWYGAMHQFQRNYNQSPHRSLAGFTPAQVHASPLLQGLVWNYIYRQGAPQEPIKFRVSDRVRIGRWKGAFEKGYSDRWSVKIYTIHSVLDHHNPPMYRLVDPAVNELIEGAFNQAELQLVRVDDEEEERGENWQIESVLDVERRGGRGEDWQYFVKWVNQPSYMNQWDSTTSTRPIRV